MLSLACGCKGPAPEQPEAEPRRVDVVASMGRAPDLERELADGTRLLLWDFHLLFHELSPAKSTYVAVLDPQGECTRGAYLVEGREVRPGFSAADFRSLLRQELPSDREDMLLEYLLGQNPEVD